MRWARRPVEWAMRRSIVARDTSVAVAISPTRGGGSRSWRLARRLCRDLTTSDFDRIALVVTVGPRDVARPLRPASPSC